MLKFHGPSTNGTDQMIMSLQMENTKTEERLEGAKKLKAFEDRNKKIHLEMEMKRKENEQADQTNRRGKNRSSVSGPSHKGEMQQLALPLSAHFSENRLRV